MRRKKKSENMPVGYAVVLLVIGLSLGTVFTFGVQYWGEPIERGDAVSVSASFESYRIIHGRWSSINEIVLRFEDREQLSIDGACVSEAVLDGVEALREGALLDMLVHPNSDTVWELKHGGEVILLFEKSQKSIRAENTGFAFLGVFEYFCAAMGLGSLLMRLKKRKPRRKK